ncbi:MAG: 2-hydroxyglutaryl-CoA dehydratase [Chloroflexota bacterium]|nr:2-hydroxyglutaryl-CoA dehydratase [Chloroflexota bacterium]
MFYTAGIDLGSTYSKAIVLSDKLEVVATAVRRTGFKLGQAGESVFQELLAAGGLERSQVCYVATTGYGRYTVPFRHTQITELTCHAQAASQLFPGTRTILDIGGQDIKALKIDQYGRVRAFRLNDKCAAGTGAFLEKTARYLGLTTDDIGPYAVRSTSPVEVSSVCAVFAESEVINHLSSGVPAEDIMRGAIVALAGRAVQLMRRVGLEPEYTLAGGMTRNVAMVEALATHLKAPLNVPPDGLGQLNGAYGAALLGVRRVQKLLAEGKPIPPTASAIVPVENPFGARRRWSARAAVPSAEACAGPAGCSIVQLLTKKASAAA